MSDLAAPRRRRLIALLQTRDDWVRVPGARSPAGDGEQSTASEGAESEVERQERKARERRYRERVEAETEGRVEGGPTRNEAAYRAHMASGSYRELDVALRHLKRKQPYSYFILDRLFIQAVPMQVQDYRLDAALRALSDQMPTLLRVPVHELDPPLPDDKVERDRRIAAWAAAGKSTRWIAGRAGVTQPRVVQILGRQRKLAA